MRVPKHFLSIQETVLLSILQHDLGPAVPSFLTSENKRIVEPNSQDSHEDEMSSPLESCRVVA